MNLQGNQNSFEIKTEYMRNKIKQKTNQNTCKHMYVCENLYSRQQIKNINIIINKTKKNRNRNTKKIYKNRFN